MILDMAFTSRLTQGEVFSKNVSMALEGPPFHRSRPLRVLFVHRDADAIDACVQELEKAQFTVSSDCVLNLAQCGEQLRSKSYDVIIVEYTGSHGKGSRVFQLLHQPLQEIALIFLTPGLGSKSLLELTAEGSFEYVEREHIAQLPMVVRRALNHKELRKELAEVKKALRHSQSLYRALEDNPTYGIYRCDAEGKLLDVNQTLVTLLGYASKEQLLAAHQESEIIPNFRAGSLFAGRIPETKRIEPVEIEWKRKDATTLKVRLSGRGVCDDHGNFAGHEIIAVDVTEQCTLAAALVGQRICELLAKDTEKPPLSVSVGVAGYPQDADAIGTLLYAADRALYAMKANKPGSPLSAHSPYSFSGDSNTEFHESRE